MINWTNHYALCAMGREVACVPHVKQDLTSIEQIYHCCRSSKQKEEQKQVQVFSISLMLLLEKAFWASLQDSR